jgi:hypothetical protein
LVTEQIGGTNFMFVKAQWPFYPPLNEEIVFTLIWLIYSYSLHTELQYGG